MVTILFVKTFIKSLLVNVKGMLGQQTSHVLSAWLQYRKEAQGLKYKKSAICKVIVTMLKQPADSQI